MRGHDIFVTLLESEIGALLAVPMVGIHLGSAPERSPRWATGFEEWIDI